MTTTANPAPSTRWSSTRRGDLLDRHWPVELDRVAIAASRRRTAPATHPAPISYPGAVLMALAVLLVLTVTCALFLASAVA